MKNSIKYYIIHNLEKARYDNIIKILNKNGINLSNVTFINHPNKNELTYQIKKQSVVCFQDFQKKIFFLSIF